MILCNVICMLNCVKTQEITSDIAESYNIVSHSYIPRLYANPFWIKDTRAYHCVMKSVPIVKIGAEVRLTSVPFRLFSVPFISIPPNRGGSNLRSYCALFSLILSHLSNILKSSRRYYHSNIDKTVIYLYIQISHVFNLHYNNCFYNGKNSITIAYFNLLIFYTSLRLNFTVEISIFSLFAILLHSFVLKVD